MLPNFQKKPYHEEFFEKTPYNYDIDWRREELEDLIIEPPIELQYMKRHRVLFNLYSFDSYRSNLTHSPTLNLIDCDFKYFLDK